MFAACSCGPECFSPYICPISSQGHKVPSDWQGRCACSSHTSFSAPPYPHETVEGDKNERNGAALQDSTNTEEPWFPQTTSSTVDTQSPTVLTSSFSTVASLTRRMSSCTSKLKRGPEGKQMRTDQEHVEEGWRRNGELSAPPGGGGGDLLT